MRKLLYLLLWAAVLTGCHPTSQTDVLNRAIDAMRVYQRTADNRAFYEQWLRARHAIDRIQEEEASLTPAEREQFLWARDEFYLISVTYHHTMGHYDQVQADMDAIDETELAARDSAQWRHYHFMRSLAAHVGDEELARQAWELSHYGDSAYWVTESRIHRAAALNKAGLCLASLDTLQLAYDCIAEDNVPECLCRISEQVSVAYAGLGKKDSSDIYRNIYLDMLEVIRENKELEYRTAEAERRTAEVRRLSGAFLIFLVAFIIGFAVLAVLAQTRHRQFTRRMGERHDERMEQFYDELTLHRGRLAENKRAYVRRKASLAIVTSIIPYIDRMRHALNRTSQNDSKRASQVDLSYVSELAERIEKLNDILAGWIQTRQGIVGLHIETFAVSGLFDILSRRRSAFERQGLQLDVADTDAWVKADRALTLFMLNTLTDNARKFTPEGGHISLSTDVKDDYVELSVSDTGVGLSEEDIKEILGHKVVDVSRIGGEGAEHGSGFGLMNCKGIIDKYQKTDSFFSVCQLGIDSTPGQGSRFWFRLPKAVRRAMTIVMAIATTYINANADEQMLNRAAALADSVYYANLEGRYEDAICFGDSALSYLNADLRQRSESELDTLTLTGQRGGLIEKQWWMSDFETDYYTILDVRNELAIAYLALHQLDNYRFNNRSYTELYKLTSEDTTLADYIAQMQQTRRDIVTMLVVGLMVLLAFIIFWWTYIVRPRKALRHELERRDKELEQMMDEDNEMRRVRYEENRLHVQNMVLDNCLSTIKHETSYYPGRIRKMADHLSSASEPDRKQLLDMVELTDFYREIFGTLTSCAARQLEESPFRRLEISCEELLGDAATYLQDKAVSTGLPGLSLQISHDGSSISGDEVMLSYLMESLIDEALSGTSRKMLENYEKMRFHRKEDNAEPLPHPLSMSARSEDKFVVIRFTNLSKTLTPNELQELFYPSANGTGYIICRQIVREHDEYFGHIGCRIKAERATPEGGLTILFTLPASKRIIRT